jgi:excisionase family DNA binding protein
MKDMILTNLSKEDLKSIIEKSVSAAIKEHLPKDESKAGGNPDEFVTKKEAAELLKCSTSTIDNYRRAGKLTRYHLGKSVKFKKEDVLALANLSI